MIKKIILIFLFWRLVLFLPLFVAENTLNYRKGAEFTRLWYYTKKYEPINSLRLSPWTNFDGVHYLNIAGNGYSDNGRFFPLYPLMIRLLSFGSAAYQTTAVLAALLVSNLAFLGAIIVMVKLLLLDFKKQTVVNAILFLLVFPASFFFVGAYTESLFLLFSLLSFYFARKKRWLSAGLTGSLLAITRPIGLLIIFPLIYELIAFEKKRSKKTLTTIYYLLIIPSGVVAYAVFSYYKWQDPLFFLHAQALLNNGRTVSGFIFPLQTVFRYLKIFISVSPGVFEWWVALLEVSAFLSTGYLLIIGWLKKIRPSYLLFSCLCFAVPVFSGTFSGLPRYAAVLFPIYIVLAQITNKYVKYSLLVISYILQLILLVLFSRGYFIA